MKTERSRIESVAGRGKNAWSAFVGLLVAILFSTSTFAQAPAAGGAPTPLSAEQLTTLVGPIALYPDDLVAIILPAATSPLQIVQVDRYLEKRKSDPKLKIDDKWDDPVKSLANYPEVVKMMSSDLDWTSELGEAVVEDQKAVLEAVQIFRRQGEGGREPEVRRQAGGEDREGNHHHRTGGSAGDLCAAVQPDHRGGAERTAGLLRDAVPRVLLPVSARRRTGDRPGLGRRDRRGVERQPLRLGRRQRHQHQQHHQHQSRRQHGQSRRRASGRRKFPVEIEQAAGAGEQFGRQVSIVEPCR